MGENRGALIGADASRFACTGLQRALCSQWLQKPNAAFALQRTIREQYDG